MTINEWNAYIGLEMAMSLCKLNEISDYWSTKPFLRQVDFGEVMGRSRFQEIRGKVTVCAPDSVSPAEKDRDPLWHTRYLLKHLQTQFAAMAVPVGVSSLDETSVRTTARTKAKSYIPSKPDKYAVRFYAVVSWSPLYIHTLWDNSSGLVSNLSPAERYVQTFPEMRTPLHATSRRPGVVLDLKKPSAVWAAMIGHQTKTVRAPSAAVSESVKRVENMDRGSWELVTAVEPVANWKELEKQHKTGQKHLAKRFRRACWYLAVFMNEPNYLIL
ncbi:hypothetical protein PHMEG_00026682 [Phytophthora megakarya]|uniref:PiggyBac transposable element-derived protein domain-containing protein n=1 Tax=Phytophthora megakarya TaxID=4795 RepID=A0A225VBK8_9STRA|nr:hypothetical protein PHMEG_00026682 [Phytophthora megakarya]